jgi:hypothetical protein
MPSTPFSGRANLVAHIGQELRLGEVGALGAVAGLDHLDHGRLLAAFRGVELAQNPADAQGQGHAGRDQQQDARQDQGRGLADDVQARLLWRPGQPAQRLAVRTAQGERRAGRRSSRDQPRPVDAHLVGEDRQQAPIDPLGADHDHRRSLAARPGGLFRRHRRKGDQIDRPVHPGQAVGGLGDRRDGRIGRPGRAGGGGLLAADRRDQRSDGGDHPGLALRRRARLVHPGVEGSIAGIQDDGQVVAAVVGVVGAHLGVHPSGIHARPDGFEGLIPDGGGGDVAVEPIQGPFQGLLDDGMLLARLQPVDGHGGERQQGAAAQHDDRHDDRPQGQQAAHRAASRRHAAQDVDSPAHNSQLHARVLKQ